MSKFLLSGVALAGLVLVAACSDAKKATENSNMSDDTAEISEAQNVEQQNPLLAPWTGPYGGVPAFDTVELKDLKSALEIGMAKNLTEIDAITANPDAPTFENTIVALERAGRDLGRVFRYWGIWSSNMSSPEFRKIQGEMAPVLSEYSSKITQNPALFARVKAVYESEEMKTLRSDQQRVVLLNYEGFARNGATLNDADKARYTVINSRLAELHTKFGNNVLADEEKYVTYISADQLGGLPDSFVKAAASAAKSRDHEGQYAITNTRSSMSPFLTYSDERDLRETVWRTYYSRGDNGDANDNNALIAEILQLRDERVALLGYDNYASWRLENRMAKTPERALELMEAVWPAAIARVGEEVADMQAIVDASGGNFKIAPWDYRYYAEKVRKDKYDLDSDEVKQYLQLDNLRDALFFVAGELFGYEFAPVPEGSVPVFHPDVKVWEVTMKDSGEAVGLWYLDPFARPGKRSGAWATTYRSHENIDGKKTVLGSNNSNFVKGVPGEPVLISWDDANTLFHEFGHALHFFASKVDYPTLNGGVRDYTEFQSQLLERWLSTDAVIDKFLIHHKTGEPIPAGLVAKIKAAATFNQGFSTTEYLASALVDMRYHTVDPTGIDPDKFERETLNDLGMPEEIPMRHRSTQFGHIFSGEGYSSGYYGYMWADVLTADAAEAFAEAPGGFYDKVVAKKLVDHLFAVRNAVDPADAYRAFRGRDANIEALMRDRGFPIPVEEKE
ncbi:MAG: M3 family metallopeptidase [Robiginitomaculum sp.]|nr:M3 family metallopeptidase [Robiginitomaculum sp.]